MFFNRINAANKLKAEMLKDEATELTNEQKKEIFEKSVMKAAKEQQMKNLHAKNLSGEGHMFLVRAYLASCRLANEVVKSEPFNNTIFFCIVVAGVLVGASTYPGMDSDPTINALDVVVLSFFCLEVVLKIMSEGVAPFAYFTGSEWTWNNFDFLIVLFSLPILPVGGSQVAFLRLIRLMRLAKVFRKVPQLRMIMTGLIGGLKSIVYIVILLLLVFYLYAIAGIFFFRENDPWHFRTIVVSLISLFRLSTLSNWADMFYINYYGCDHYMAGLYVMDPAEVTSIQPGAPMLCDFPNAQPWLSLAYFVSFIFICSFSMLSLFVGAITVSMSESMETMREEKMQQKKRKQLRQAEHKMKRSMHEEVSCSTSQSSPKKGGNHARQSMQQRRAWNLVSVAFTDGGDIETALQQEESDDFIALRQYKRLAVQLKNLTEETYFQNFITLVIVLAGVQVGINTDADLSVRWAKQLFLLDFSIRIIFTVECVLKLVAEELRPWTYFESNWNVFDFVVVVGSFVSGGGSLIVMLRLLRLLRVLKLMRMLPQLQVIVTALMSGFSSITFISIILLLFFYFFGIIAMILFSDNDPTHFGNLHITMISLFQCSTLDNWTDLLYINVYGCDVVGYDDTPEKCTNPKANFIITSLYFIVFVLLGALVLLTLFIGVVATSMEEATEEQKTQSKVDTQAALVSREHGLKYSTMCLYREVFAALDLNGGNVIDANELRLGLKAAGRQDISEKQFSRLWRSVDQDNSGGIDFSEFLLFMIALRDQKQKILHQAEPVEPVAEENAEPQTHSSSVIKLKRPLSAPKEVLRRVQYSVHATLAALRLQHGFPVLPMSSSASDDFDKPRSIISKRRSMDNADMISANKVRELGVCEEEEGVAGVEMKEQQQQQQQEEGGGEGVSSPLRMTPERVSTVPGKQWTATSERSNSREPPRKAMSMGMGMSMSNPLRSPSSNSFPDFPYDSPAVEEDARLEGAAGGSQQQQGQQQHKQQQGQQGQQGRSYEDRKRKYASRSQHSGSEGARSLVVADSRSFALEAPYPTCRAPVSPLALVQGQGQGQRSGAQSSKVRRPVVSKACFI